jgi:hypothetical protein
VDTPDEVVRRLREITERAKGNERASADLAEAGAHAADVVVWTHEHVIPFSPEPPSLSYGDYRDAIAHAEEELRAAEGNVRSACSYLQVVSSGAAAFAARAIAHRVILAPAGDPVFKLQVPEGNATARRTRLAKELVVLLPDHGLPALFLGAWAVFQGESRDNLAQAAHSIQEVLTTLLYELAPVNTVRCAPWWKEAPDTPQGVSRCQKVRFFLVGDHGTEDFRVHAVNYLVEEAFRSHGAAVKAAHHSVAAGHVAVRNTLVASEQVLETMVDTRAALRASLVEV